MPGLSDQPEDRADTDAMLCVAVSLKPIDDLVKEFLRGFRSGYDGQPTPDEESLLSEVVQILRVCIESRDAEHAALLVTAKTYADGFAEGYNLGMAGGFKGP